MEQKKPNFPPRTAYVKVEPEEEKDLEKKYQVSLPLKDGSEICFQKCIYYYDSGIIDRGFRFIKRRPNGRQQPSRGQACIPSISIINDLLKLAEKAGWGVDS